MAKRFRFRLESVLTYRTQLENERQREFGEIRRKYKDKERQIHDLNRLFSQVQEQFTDAKRKSGDIRMWLSYQSYLNDLRKNLFSCHREIGEISRKLEEKRRELVKASRDRTILEKLKEKRKDAYMKDVRLSEQKEMDEIALRNYYG